MMSPPLKAPYVSMSLTFTVSNTKKKIPKLEEVVDDDLEDCLGSATPNGKFKLHCRRVLVTYKTWLDKTMITNFFAKQKAEIVRIAHEIGTKKIDYEHSHVFVDFGKQITRTEPRCFDFEGIHPNIKPINRTKHLNRIFKYMCKYDHDNDDMLTWITEHCEVQDIWDCQTLTDAIKGVKINEVPGAIAAWGLKPQPERIPDPWKFQWQADLEHNIVNNAPPKRKILWYMDIKGGAGKTDFALGLLDRYPKDTYIFTQFGGQRDTATVIGNAIDAGWTGRYCIVDLPRDAQTKAIYEPLECIKNGLITALKYQGGMRRFTPGWLIVMANFTYEVGHMSGDRWILQDMSDKYFRELIDEITPSTQPIGIEEDPDAEDPEDGLMRQIDNIDITINNAMSLNDKLLIGSMAIDENHAE